MDSDIVEQSANFWQSPWAMASAWDNGRNLSARFFLETERLRVELELPDGDARWRAVVSGTQLKLSKSGSDDAEAADTIPLPAAVSDRVVDPIPVKDGIGEVVLERAAAAVPPLT